MIRNPQANFQLDSLCKFIKGKAIEKIRNQRGNPDPKILVNGAGERLMLLIILGLTRVAAV